MPLLIMEEMIALIANDKKCRVSDNTWITQPLREERWKRRRHIFPHGFDNFFKACIWYLFFPLFYSKSRLSSSLGNVFGTKEKDSSSLLSAPLPFFNSPSLTLKSVSVDDRNNKSVDVKLFFTICTHMKSRPTSEIHTCMNHP